MDRKAPKGPCVISYKHLFRNENSLFGGGGEFSLCSCLKTIDAKFGAAPSVSIYVKKCIDPI